MIDLRFRPLAEWKDGELTKVRSQFRSTYQHTMDLLESELKKVHATAVVIEAGYHRTDIRNDGWPRNGAKPTHPGVVLYFRTTEGDLRFPCGTYQTFEANLHAIALTLENLRAIDRYGATAGHQQYMGFKALPAGTSTAKAWTLEEAAQWLSSAQADLDGEGATPLQMVTNQEAYRTAFRICAQAFHSDHGGDPVKWAELQAVKAVLDEWHEKRGV